MEINCLIAISIALFIKSFITSTKLMFDFGSSGKGGILRLLRPFRKSKEDNISFNDSDAAKSLTKLADEAERLKFLMGYGY